MENIKEQAKRDVESTWENKLKNEFAEKANQSIKETLSMLDSELSGFNSNINQLLEDLDKKFDEEWNSKFSNMISEIEQIENHESKFSELKNINNDIYNYDNFQIFNETQKNNKNIFSNELDDNISNNINKELIGNNNYNLKNNNHNFFKNNINNFNNIDNNNFNMNSSNIQNNMNNQKNNNYNNFNMNSSIIQNNQKNQNNNNYNNFNMNNSNIQNNMNNQNNNNFNMNSSIIQNNQNNNNYSNMNSSNIQNNLNNQNGNNFNMNSSNMNNQNNINFMGHNDSYFTFNKNNNDNWKNENNINNLNHQNNNKNLISNDIFPQENTNNNNNFESDEFLRKKKVDYSKMSNPPLITLIEQDNTNQLVNLILRCLSNILMILPYYFNPNKEEKILKKSKEDPNGVYLGPSFLKLLDNIWKSSKKEYCPNEFHIALKKLMGNNYYSNNPGYIMEFILNQLDKELNFNPFGNMGINDNHLNQNMSFTLFIKQYENNQTKISNCFFSTIKTQKKCSFCQQSTYYFHMTPVVNIILESTNENIVFNQLNLNEHLNNLLMEEKDENKNEYCSKCNCERKKYIMKEIFYAFGLIIFYINREKNPECPLFFNYPEKFSGKKLINKEYDLHDYQLISVIKKNPNEYNNFGNYIAYCKSFTNDKWYSYYQQNISMVQNINEIFDNKNACLLIYCEMK